MSEIRAWVEQQFVRPDPTIIEIGANVGMDTEWLAEIPGSMVLAVEADPRNVQPLRDRVGRLSNVCVRAPLAIASHDGTAELTMSATYHDKPWTESSSICRPTGHLVSLPHISFYDRTVTVDCLTLDTLTAREQIKDVQFIWCDAQGAEPLVIAGGQRTLARTRYLYAEVPPTEEYAGQLPLDELTKLLPGAWRVVHRWPSDVLLARE